MAVRGGGLENLKWWKEANPLFSKVKKRSCPCLLACSVMQTESCCARVPMEERRGGYFPFFFFLTFLSRPGCLLSCFSSGGGGGPGVPVHLHFKGCLRPGL